jgi:hypothetical protein
VPVRSSGPQAGSDHEAGARDVGRLRAAADAEHERADPSAKATESLAYTRAGVDSGEIIIRGGSHLDFSFIPNPAFGASLRGADEIAWYTTVWFDKYLKHNPKADARLLTDRWRHDRAEAAVDPKHDGNMFSFYYPSRLDIRLADGRRVRFENMRKGCGGRLTDHDGWPGEFSYVKLDTSRDRNRRATLKAAPRRR